MEIPLIVGFLRDREAKQNLSRLACDFHSVSSRKRMLATDDATLPRIFVIELVADQTDATRDLVQALTNQRPLADVLVWAPRARAATVRELFRVGARDVVVSQAVTKLTAAVEDLLASQRALPHLRGLRRPSQQRRQQGRYESLLSRSPVMWELFDLCSRIAAAEATVLIVGETGTGKELLARAIHRQSRRRGRFVAANCASIPAELINSELFGHNKGAFTGAEQAKKGLVTHASGGTLFLDEIGDMTPEVQQSLLRMLQEKQVRPVGSLVETAVDVRVVAATNVSLDRAVRAGKFREDLFYRLDVIRMNVPPLRERPEDVLYLFGHFTKRLAKQYGLDTPTYAESFLNALCDFDWPGNVRQLENLSERLVLARPQRVLTAQDFATLRSSTPGDEPPNPLPSSDNGVTVDPSQTLAANLESIVQQREYEYLQAVLQENKGKIAESAAQAGISRRTLLRKMKQHDLEKHQFKQAAKKQAREEAEDRSNPSCDEELPPARAWRGRNGGSAK